MGLIQLSHGSPALPPLGTRPDAIAPATAPMQNGTITDEIANAAPKLRRLEVSVTSLRNAKLEPRRTMPSAASESGTKSVSVIDANASEKPVHSTTRQKMSHTWLASHTGPMECATTARGGRPARRRPRGGPRTPRRSRRRANIAYAVTPKNRMTATTSGIRHPPARRSRRSRRRGGSLGAYGPPGSSAVPASRNRRLMPRRINVRLTATPT